MVLDIASVGLLLTLVGLIVMLLTYSLTKKKEDKQEIKEDCNAQTRLEMQLNYISRGVDDIRLELKAQDNKINTLSEKVARLEESTKSAHKRLDEGGM